jgi:chromosome segregation ATPase
MRALRLKTESRMLELEKKITEHEKLNLENEAEKARHCEEKDEAQRLLALLKGQLKQHQAQESKQVELINKHKEERENFENELQEQRKKLQAKQSRELESQRVAEQLEAEKAKKAEIVGSQRVETDFENDCTNQKIAELEEKLKDLEEEVEGKDALVGTLTTAQRQANDEVEDAKDTILHSRMLHKYGTSEIGLKSLGELHTEGWLEVCEDKFSTHEAFSAWTSKMEEKLRGQDFVPLKTVPNGKGGHMV